MVFIGFRSPTCFNVNGYMHTVVNEYWCIFWLPNDGVSKSQVLAFVLIYIGFSSWEILIESLITGHRVTD